MPPPIRSPFSPSSSPWNPPSVSSQPGQPTQSTEPMLDQLAGRPSPSWRRSQVSSSSSLFLPLAFACVASAAPHSFPSLLSHHPALLFRKLTSRLVLQVFLVLLFWISRIALTSPKGPRFLFLRRLNAKLYRFTPWQIILSTLTVLYALRHGDVLLGLQAPEPLARLYSRDYYRCVPILLKARRGGG